MTDVENYVVDQVAKALRAEFKGIFVVSTDTDAPSKFPAVCFWEQSNIPLASTQTAHSRENYTELMYQGNIYTLNHTSGANRTFAQSSPNGGTDAAEQRATGGKQQCRKIAAVIDRVMTGMGFIRIFGQPVLNPSDTSISRYSLRYKGIVGKDGIVYTS